MKHDETWTYYKEFPISMYTDRALGVLKQVSCFKTSFELWYNIKNVCWLMTYFWKINFQWTWLFEISLSLEKVEFIENG